MDFAPGSIYYGPNLSVGKLSASKALACYKKCDRDGTTWTVGRASWPTSTSANPITYAAVSAVMTGASHVENIAIAPVPPSHGESAHETWSISAHATPFLLRCELTGRCMARAETGQLNLSEPDRRPV